MKFNFFVLILGLIFLVSLSSFTGYIVLVKIPEKTFNVTKVLDGDTIEIETGEKVRLLGINAPEINEHYYQEAKDRLAELVNGKLVKLEAGREDKDIYGRLLRYVFVDDVFVNLQLLREGYATVYITNPEEKYYLDFKTAEKEARQNKLGLWATSNITQCITIVVFNYDTVGNDNENLNDEYVTFQNNCETAINMNNWTVKDAATNIYTFKSFVLSGNSRVTLYTGSGSDTSNELYWNKKRAVWNNDGDTLFLRNDKGNLILSYSYP
ncbi:MAG: thermonuclease family protein [Candidatus Aenigmatarchaeota archaeon]